MVPTGDDAESDVTQYSEPSENGEDSEEPEERS
jgi:hypothetical protein